ncbi:hypothetical protein VP01_1606g1 [Puccinia sorghi]|uniref:Tc1-like transposase DDE domain-containing protein n=1 Tax=Puccinia sorghi TaxID=27349 RepID=A0A0L6VJ31_9BASI|nr:hypothetical protein VP01_1606g1 [Puccinia sorghi]
MKRPKISRASSNLMPRPCKKYTRMTNIGQKLIFIDESGFLFLFFCQSRIDLFYFIFPKKGQAAVLKTNARGSMINLVGWGKKTGTTLTNICNFLDNARIHGGEDFYHIQTLLKESLKKISIEFLPKYLPNLMTIWICSKSFLHCQKFYSTPGMFPWHLHASSFSEVGYSADTCCVIVSELESHAQAMQEMHEKLVSNKSASTALKKLAKNTTKKSTAKNQSSTQCRPHQPISGEVKHLNEREIFENNKKQIDVAKTFGISNQQLKTDIVTSILLLLKDNPSTTLKKLTEHVKNDHDIQVFPGAIQKMLKKIDVTWKTVTPIPHKWNEAAFLQQQHDYVLNQVTNIGQKLIFIDESWFNSQTHPFHGYSLTGKFFYFIFSVAILKTNARGLMIKLVSAMSEEGMIHFELLNKDGKKTGTTSTDICNFLGGEDFNCIQTFHKDSLKKIGIEFLPKYSPFLNPIELVFNIIKIDVKHKEIQSRSGLAEAIRIN